ncbi:hypothetical protein [Clostridium saccharoperbutylacetonicum]
METGYEFKITNVEGMEMEIEFSSLHEQGFVQVEDEIEAERR